MNKEVPSDAKIYVLSVMHIFRILSVFFVFILPLVFVVVAIVSAIDLQFANCIKFALLSIAFHYAYPLVLDWFEDERIKFKEAVDIWSERVR